MLRWSSIPLTAALAAGLAAAAPAVANPDYAVDGPALIPPYQVVGSAADVTERGVHVRVEPLDEPARAAYFRIHTSLGADPLPTRASYPPGFTVFAVTFDNGSASEIAYAPALTACMRDKDLELPLVQPDVLFDYLRAALSKQPEPEAAATKALEAFHANRLVLEPGQRATRLLVFEGASERTARLLLLLDQLSIGTDELRLRFPFVRIGAPVHHGKGRR